MAPTRLLTISLLTLALAACQTTPTPAPVATDGPVTAPTPPATPSADPAGPAANDNLNAVAWVQRAIEYRLLSGQTWRAALEQLDRAIKTPDWDALTPDERERPARGLPLAVIVDIDETVLDNSPYQARLVRDGGHYDEVTWDAWVREEKAAPVPGALEFLRAADARGIDVFYISNRAEHLHEATLSNLRKLGFPDVDGAHFLGLGTFIENCEESGSEKGCRRRHVSRTHRVLMQFGDQLGDMVTILANTPDGREQAVQPHLAWIGERWWVLPNPTYGSWEPALFNNEWSQPEAARRRLKLDALRFD